MVKGSFGNSNCIDDVIDRCASVAFGKEKILGSANELLTAFFWGFYLLSQIDSLLYRLIISHTDGRFVLDSILFLSACQETIMLLSWSAGITSSLLA